LTNQLAAKIKKIKLENNETAIMEKAGYKKDLDVTTIEKSTLSQRKKGK
jgi:hydrogenase maturation factor